MKPARVVLLGLDGFPPELVGQDLTPRLWSLARQGGRAPEGGHTSLPSSTYPSFATLLTGHEPGVHGVRTTARRKGPFPSWAGSTTVRVPTILEAARHAGRRCAFVAGDQHLFRILAAGIAHEAWPVGGVVPERTPLDAYGYPTNAAVRPHVLRSAADPRVDLLFAQLNETDTAGHDHGPHDARALACYAATDALVGEIVDALERDWERLLLIVVSDHGMERRGGFAPIEIELPEVVVDVLADGGAALVLARAEVEVEELGARLLGIDGIARWSAGGPGWVIAEASAGRIFAAPRLPAGGQHGGPATSRTLAIVGGGHPAAAVIGRAIGAQAPRQSDWAPTIAAVLGLEMSGVSGNDLSRLLVAATA